MEYKENFLLKLKLLLPYFVKFKKVGTILSTKYPWNYIVRDSDRGLVIMIIYDKNIFSTNNHQQKIWTLESHIIPCLNQKSNGIMLSDFLLLQSQLILLSSPLKWQQELVNFGLPLKTSINSEYSEIEEEYWKDEHLLEQIKTNTLLITFISRI